MQETRRTTWERRESITECDKESVVFQSREYRSAGAQQETLAEDALDAKPALTVSLSPQT